MTINKHKKLKIRSLHILLLCQIFIFTKTTPISAQSFEDFTPCNTNTSLADALSNKNNVECLILYYQGLEDLPDYVKEFEKLKLLELSGNALNKVPEAVGGLNKLLILNLSNNSISTLPDFIGNLPELKVLVISNNQFITVPQVIYKLHGLIQLDIRGNNINQNEIDDLIPSLPECEIIY